jgi:hypothetical protein
MLLPVPANQSEQKSSTGGHPAELLYPSPQPSCPKPPSASRREQKIDLESGSREYP